MLNKKIILSLVFVFFITPVSVFSQEMSTDQSSEYSDIVTSVMSPFCPGKLLHDCPSEKATELKDSIKSMLIEGDSKDKILNYLNDQFGSETLRSAPESSGFGAVGWYMPAAFLIFGVGIYLFWIKVTDSKGKNLQISNLNISEDLLEIEKRVLEDLRNKN